MPFKIVRGDITAMECDAIVNAANSGLYAGGGVCGAIFAAAGREKLTEACRKIGFCATGEAVITDGFDLRAKYVIHTVGPIYGKDPENQVGQLYDCYMNSLRLAESKGLESIAFPLISSGIYGYPKDQALEIATFAIRDFLENSEMQVYLVIFDLDDFRYNCLHLDGLDEYVNLRFAVERENILFAAQEDHSDLYKEKPKSSKRGSGGRLIKVISSTFPSTEIYPQSVDFEGRKPARKERSLSDLVERKVETFSEMLLRLIDEKGMTDVEVYKRANIDRRLFSKIRKKEYIPKKNTVIALVIGLKLNMDEARDLMGRAGYAFSECNRLDIIVEYFINRKNYNIHVINETLFAYEEQQLGA